MFVSDMYDHWLVAKCQRSLYLYIHGQENGMIPCFSAAAAAAVDDDDVVVDVVVV